MVGVNITSINPGVRIHHSKYGMGTVIKDPENLTRKGEAYIIFDNGTDRIDERSMDPDRALWSVLCQKEIIDIKELS
jgi:hypothetical protein